MLARARRFSPRRFSPNFATKRLYEAKRTSSRPKECRNLLNLLGATLGLIGASYVTADYRSQDEAPRPVPTRSAYKFLICGGGVAAQEALKVFVDHGAADDVLLIAPEWIDCRRWLHHDHALKPSSKHNEINTISKLLLEFQNALSSSFSLVFGRKSPEIVIGPKVKSIDASERTAKLCDGSEISFERCLIAVGSTIPEIPIGKVVSRDAAGLVSGAQSKPDWEAIETVIQDGEQAFNSSESRPHLTVVGGGWMSMAVGAALVDRGADVTFSHSEPAFLARYLPKYLGQEVFTRFLWQSEGGVDTLSYSALRYIIARKPLLKSFRPIEAEVHVGTVFDAFSIVNFRTDHVIFAPTLPSKIPVEIPSIPQEKGLVVNPELAVASDIYAAGACISVEKAPGEYPEVMRWSADHAIATARHAALNILGAREPYSYIPMLTVNLDPLCLHLHIIGDVDGYAESFGYFRRSKERDEKASGGQLETGVLFCVKPAPLSYRGAAQRLCITGVMIWEGSKMARVANIATAKQTAMKFVGNESLTRPELEAAMDSFASDQLGISLFADGPEPAKRSPVELPLMPVEAEGEEGDDMSVSVLKPVVDLRKPSPRVIWRRHTSARISRVRAKELLWVEDEYVGAVSPQTGGDKISEAYSDLLKNAAGKD